MHKHAQQTQLSQQVVESWLANIKTTKMQKCNKLRFPLGPNEMVDVTHHVRFFRSPSIIAKLVPILLDKLGQRHGAVVAETEQFSLPKEATEQQQVSESVTIAIVTTQR